MSFLLLLAVRDRVSSTFLIHKQDDVLSIYPSDFCIIVQSFLLHSLLAIHPPFKIPSIAILYMPLFVRPFFLVPVPSYGADCSS